MWMCSWNDEFFSHHTTAQEDNPSTRTGRTCRMTGSKVPQTTLQATANVDAAGTIQTLIRVKTWTGVPSARRAATVDKVTGL